MIGLIKEPEPKILADNAIRWTNEIDAHQAAGTKPTKTQLNHYNHTDIKSALRAETKSKCAYCESKFDHIAYGDIEHIVAKKNGSNLRFKWSNLTLACDICNTKKGDKDGIIDPYTTNPESVFVYAGAVMIPDVRHREAVLTFFALELDRTPLVDRRSERLKSINKIVILALQNPNPTIRQAIIDDLKINEVKPNKEFAAMVRAYVDFLVSKGLI